jgi:hypothetical protein
VRRIAFDGVTAGTPEVVPSPDLWRWARGSWVVNDTAYTFWNIGTVTSSPVSADTTALPAQQQVETDALWITDVRASFYDPTTKRIYESVSDKDNALYYRSFNLQSNTVGQPVLFSENAGNVDWNDVSDMFLAGGRLFWVSTAIGDLHSIRWEHGATVAGTQQVVSGPALDGIDWRGASIMFTD